MGRMDAAPNMRDAVHPVSKRFSPRRPRAIKRSCPLRFLRLFFFLREENTPRARDSIYIIPKFSLFSSCPSVAIDIGSVPLDREYVN